MTASLKQLGAISPRAGWRAAARLDLQENNLDNAARILSEYGDNLIYTGARVGCLGRRAHFVPLR